jgi:hypothetical protein
MAAGTNPIIVGPWITEVGYELLYWIPFVAWAQHEYGLDPSRLIVVSRGGVQSWYAHLTTRYHDIFSLVTPEVFRARNDERIRATGAAKHFEVGRLDGEILQAFREATGISGDVLHPSLMYRVFWAYRPWTPEFRQFVRWAPFRPVTPLDGLPDRYVAVRFYGSGICPETSGTRRRIAETVRALLAAGDVVLLNTGVQCDDHREFVSEVRSPRLHRIAHRLTPATNLEVQTRAIAGASSFVGTYGGYAYLPPLLGVSAKTVYSDARMLHKLRKHVRTARDVFRSDPRYGSLTIRALQAPHREYAYA